MKEKDMKKMKKNMNKITKSGRKILYEITMYKLLVILLVGLLVSLVIGLYLGNIIGKANAVDNIEINVPRYCSYDKSMSNIDIKCNELSNMTATEMCEILSTPLKNQLKVLVVR